MDDKKFFIGLLIFGILLFGFITLMSAATNRSTHIVKPGESWSSIASEHGTTIEELERLNNRSRTEILHVGDEIRYPIDWNQVFNSTKIEVKDSTPDGEETTQPNGGQEANYYRHEVKTGENLSSIARLYGVSVQDILAINPQIKDPNIIHTGDLINIPEFQKKKNVPSNTSTDIV